MTIQGAEASVSAGTEVEAKPFRVRLEEASARYEVDGTDADKCGVHHQVAQLPQHRHAGGLGGSIRGS